MFVSDLRQVGGFLQFPPKTDCHDITEILLKVALNTINQKNVLVLKDHALGAKELVYQDGFYCTTNSVEFGMMLEESYLYQNNTIYSVYQSSIHNMETPVKY
jgi:hypothetical protein